MKSLAYCLPTTPSCLNHPATHQPHSQNRRMNCCSVAQRSLDNPPADWGSCSGHPQWTTVAPTPLSYICHPPATQHLLKSPAENLNHPLNCWNRSLNTWITLWLGNSYIVHLLHSHCWNHPLNAWTTLSWLGNSSTTHPLHSNCCNYLFNTWFTLWLGNGYITHLLHSHCWNRPLNTWTTLSWLRNGKNIKPISLASL